jgi:hypothetical protein
MPGPGPRPGISTSTRRPCVSGFPGAMRRLTSASSYRPDLLALTQLTSSPFTANERSRTTGRVPGRSGRDRYLAERFCFSQDFQVVSLATSQVRPTSTLSGGERSSPRWLSTLQRHGN